MKELYYNGKLILGVDHGYGNMKTAHRIFAASVEKEVQLGANALEYKGKEYGIGGGHKEFQVQKINDEDYWILTLAAVAEELKFRGKNEAILHVAAGVPLFWVKEQKESFREYLLCEKDVHFKYNGESYHVVIADASIHPQGYAAFINYDGDIRGNTVLADIGNGTMNVAFMQNGKPLAGKIFTEQFGVYQCMKKARNEVMRNCQCEVPDHIIEEVFRKGTADIPGRYIQAVSGVAKDYVMQVFSKLREYGYNPDLMKLYVIGGGGCLIKNFAEYDAKKEHRKAWDYMQTMDRSVEKTYSKVIIKSLIRYFENADAENKAEISENYWERFRSEMGNLLRGQTALPAVEMEKLAEKEDNSLPKISEDVLDALEDLF